MAITGISTASQIAFNVSWLTSSASALEPDKIIGVSAQTVEQALLAQKHGADYLGVGAVFTTGSKADADDVSHETLKAICEAVDTPIILSGPRQMPMM